MSGSPPSPPRCRAFNVSPKGRLSEHPDPSTAVQACRAGFLWIDFTDPERALVEPLVDLLGIHPLSVEDCLDDDQVPKIEDYGSNTFILINVFQYKGDTLGMEEFDCILGRAPGPAGRDEVPFLITSHKGGPFYDRLPEMVAANPAAVGRGPDFLLQVVLDWIVDAKIHAIDSIQERIDATEEQILGDLSHFSAEHLMQLRRDLLKLRKVLFHEREILVKICRRDSPFISEKAIFHFRDIYDHLAKFHETVEIARETISSLMEMYLTMVNNEMSRSAARTNQVMRRLTLITTVFMPLTLLAGVGGMSEWSMMTGPENWRVSYPLFLLAMTLIGVGNYYLLKWVDRKRPAQGS